jgi:hypothetical protein
MNLFQFYQEAAINFATNTKLFNDYDDEVNSATIREIRKLQKAYQEDATVSYVDPFTRFAYCMHFAPKHAVIWRYLTRTLQSSYGDNVCLNFCGFGPASELIGVLEGCNLEDGASFDIAAFDSESGWNDIGTHIVETYSDKRGISIRCNYSSFADNLHPQTMMFGSFILSDMARSGQLGNIRSLVPSEKRPLQAQFLDFPMYTDKQNKRVLLSNTLNCAWMSLKNRGLNPLPDVINEYENCDSIRCDIGIPSKLSLNVFFMDFK